MKRTILVPLLICISFLNMGFIRKPKLQGLYCSVEKNLNTKSFEDKWKDYPWIYDVKTGKLYDYDEFLNEINPLEYDKVGDYSYSYKSRIIDNILKIRETETSPFKDEVIGMYSINLDKNKSSYNTEENPKDITTTTCEEIDLPKAVKINY